MKSIEIFKTNKEFKIITLYMLQSGSYIASNPIFIFPADVEVKDLSNSISEALKESRILNESEEDKFWLGNGLLKKIKESSFNKFYATSSSCYISLVNGIISIIPQKYMGKDQGLEMQENLAYRVAINDNNRLEVIEKLKEMLMVAPMHL